MPPSLREVAERSEDGGSVVYTMGHSPSHGLRRASPLSVGAKGCRRKGERYMKATGIVRRVDDLGRIVIPKEIRRTLRIREGDPSHTTLTVQEQFCFAMMRFHERVYAKKP